MTGFIVGGPTTNGFPEELCLVHSYCVKVFSTVNLVISPSLSQMLLPACTSGPARLLLSSAQNQAGAYLLLLLSVQALDYSWTYVQSFAYLLLALAQPHIAGYFFSSSSISSKVWGLQVSLISIQFSHLGKPCFWSMQKLVKMIQFESYCGGSVGMSVCEQATALF